MRQFRAAFAALLLLASFQTQAAVGVKSVQIVPSADGTLYSAFPDGDGPTDPGTTCDVPTGWACTTVGTGTGSIVKQSDTVWDFDVIGNSATQSNVFAYKDAGTGDVELIARITDSYTGATGNFAGLGIGIREGNGVDDWQMLCFSPQTNVATVRSLYGAAGTYTASAGASGQSRPRYAAVTYDVSLGVVKCHESSDGVTYTEVSSTTRTLADAIAFISGQSASLTASFQGTVDNISLGSSLTVYTPEDPPGDDAPTLLSQIENQNLSQGISFSLCVSGNFSGATSYTATGLPGAGGLSFNTSTGCVSGTPNGDDASASPFNVEFCAVNPFGTACDTAQFSVSSAPGDVFTMSDVGDSTASTFNCATTDGANGSSWASIRTSGSGTRPQAGDTIVIPGETRGPTTFQNCQGTTSAPIIIRNDASDSTQAVIRFAGSGGFALRCSNCTNIRIDGSSGYSGATTDPLLTSSYGILLTKTGASQPTHYLRADQLTCVGSDSDENFCWFGGIAVDAVANSGGTGICFSLNDHGFTRAANPGVWRENITYEGNLAKYCGGEGEGFYIGPNQGNDDIPLRNISFLDNVCLDTGRECINVKSVMAGNNVMTGNRCYRPGLPQTGTQNDCFNINSAASWLVSRNDAVGAGGHCFAVTHQDVNGIDTASPSSVYQFENNFCVGTGKNTGNFYGFDLQGSATASAVAAAIRYNTVVDADAGFISARNRFTTGTCSAENNISADNGTNAPSGCADVNNRKGTIAAQNFVNDSTGSGSAGGAPPGDFRLTTSSPARNSASGSCPNEDYDQEARPQQTTCDQGADEYTP